MPMSYKLNAREKEIENRLRKDYFAAFDAEEVLGDVDFSVGIPQDDLHLFEQEYLLWAEAKKSNHHDIYESLVQLILTIGKARTFDHHLPPAFLGAFDAEKIAFLPYHRIIDVFSLSYIDWTIRPSNHESETFRLLLSIVKETLERETLIYSFDHDDRLLRTFIKRNFVSGKSRLSKVRINKTNFTAIFQKWLREVKPTIAVNWEIAKRNGIIPADFYLADILSEHNVTLREKLYAVLRKDHYELDRCFDESGFLNSKEAQFNDKQKAHIRFWNRYERPPRRDYWDEIVERRDLLVPQNVREIKGSFFTPAKWVSLSQQYLSDEFGENWQNEYYIWDCAAGTGNLLANLTNRYNIWASTLDKADVAAMYDRIKTMNEASVSGKGSNLLESHVFQFDFLNDPFTKLPEKLQEIINNEEKRRKLIIYINPPYVEASNKRTTTGTGENRTGVSISCVKLKYKKELGRAVNEIYAQFFARVWHEIPGCHIAMFSTLKTLQGPNFTAFRKNYRAKLKRVFVVPASTFDNVKGSFPIGFQIWDTAEKEEFSEITADVYDAKEYLIGKKKLYSYNNGSLILDWLHHYDKIIQKKIKHKRPTLAYLRFLGTDFQNNNGVFWTLDPSENDLKQVKGRWVDYLYVKYMTIYFSVRHCIEQNWLNNRDQFLSPNGDWEHDSEFQGDCLVYSIFHGQNRISSKHGINHFIPFYEKDVNAKDTFKSHFLIDYISGIVKKEYTNSCDDDNSKIVQGNFFDPDIAVDLPSLSFSEGAMAVLDVGRELWRYYHQQPEAIVDASFYDIRLYFQRTHPDKKGKEVMNSTSEDPTYNKLLKELRLRMKILARQIAEKTFEYGFLKRNYDPLNQRQKIYYVQQEFKPPMDEEAEVPMNTDGTNVGKLSIEESIANGGPIININIQNNTVNNFTGVIDNLTINE